MEKYCKSCGRVFKDSDFKICPYCGSSLSTREGRQPIPRKLRHQVFQRDGYRCRECGATNKETRLHVDHIKPVAKGGTNDLSNLQTLCEACNKAKYTDEWVGGVSSNLTKHNYEYLYKQAKKDVISFRMNHSRINSDSNQTNAKKTKSKGLHKSIMNRIDDDFLPFLCEFIGDEKLSKTDKRRTVDVLISKYSAEEIHKFISAARIPYSRKK